MAEKLFLELISPEKVMVSAEVDYVLAVGECGEFGLLPGHSAFLTSLKISRISFSVNGETIYAAISKGFLEASEDKVIVLVEKCEFGKDVDIHKAKEMKALAEKAAEEAREVSEEAFVNAVAAMEYEDARILAAELSK